MTRLGPLFTARLSALLGSSGSGWDDGFVGCVNFLLAVNGSALESALAPSSDGEAATEIATNEWTASEALAADTAIGEALQCTQRAGDVLFVPMAWGHATRNEAASVGMSIEFMLATEEAASAGLPPM